MPRPIDKESAFTSRMAMTWIRALAGEGFSQIGVGHLHCFDDARHQDRPAVLITISAPPLTLVRAPTRSYPVTHRLHDLHSPAARQKVRCLTPISEGLAWLG
jgi:hypothetical protein